MNGLLELLTNKHWMINPDYVQGIRAMLQHNLTTHAALELPEKVMGYPVSADGSNRILADYGEYYKVEEPFINFEIINGPITRNGDACSYGSRDHRDMMMMAADSPYCVGHIFSINTPGGSAWAKNDYQQAIDYAHSKGQRVIAFIDGMCCSAGMYLAALCDERYYMHPKDQIGCIGVMAAFFSIGDGEKIYTNETYHELYDPESFDKNKEMRDIANDGNDELLIADLASLGVEFRADVKKACPKAEEEHLHGKVFDAQDVDGILMDGQKNLAEVIALFAKDAKLVAKRTSQQATASARMQAGAAKAAIQQEQNQAGLDSAEREQARPQVKENILSTQLNNVTEMKEKFPALFAALAVEEMQMTEEGAFMNMDLLATLNAAIEAKQQETADAKALADQLTAEKAELESQLAAKATEMETLNTEHASAIETLNAEHATAIEEKDKEIEAKNLEIQTLTENAGKADEALKAKDETIATMTTDMEGMKASLETAQNTIAERDQQITDLNAQVEELTHDAGEQPAAGASPQNNGDGVQDPAQYQPNSYVYNNDLTYEENDEAEKQWKAEHGVK